MSGSSPDRRRRPRANHPGKALPLQSPAFRDTAVAPPGAIGCRLSRQRNIHAIVCAASPPYAPRHAMNLPRLTLSLALLAALAAPTAHAEIAIDSIAGSDVSLEGLIQADGNWFDNDLADLTGIGANGKDSEYELRRAETVLKGQGPGNMDWVNGYDAKADNIGRAHV